MQISFDLSHCGGAHHCHKNYPFVVRVRDIVVSDDLSESGSEDLAFLENSGGNLMGSLLEVDVGGAHFIGTYFQSIHQCGSMILLLDGDPCFYHF
jgi:hypothetical protein